MARIIFVTSSGKRITVEGSEGSIMELAVENDIEGIDGDCGGVCSCATCHVHVAPDYFMKLEPADAIESDLLEFQDDVDEYSRLACQIEIDEELDGMVLQVAQ